MPDADIFEWRRIRDPRTGMVHAVRFLKDRYRFPGFDAGLAEACAKSARAAARPQLRTDRVALKARPMFSEHEELAQYRLAVPAPFGPQPRDGWRGPLAPEGQAQLQWGYEPSKKAAGRLGQRRVEVLAGKTERERSTAERKAA